jgi:hypothetical protein
MPTASTSTLAEQKEGKVPTATPLWARWWLVPEKPTPHCPFPGSAPWHHNNEKGGPCRHQKRAGATE